MSKREEREAKIAAHMAGTNSGGMSLLAAPPPTTPSATNSGAPAKRINRDYCDIHPDLIDPDQQQPRNDFDGEDGEDALALAKSMKRHGQLQPAIVYKNPDRPGRYVIVTGERRWRAAKNNKESLSCRVLETKPEPRKVRLWQLIENIQRKDLNLAEIGAACRDLRDEDKLSIAEIVEQLDISDSYVRRALSLEDNGPDELKEAVSSGAVTGGAGYQASRIKDEEERRDMAKKLVNGQAKEEDARAAADKNRRTTRGRRKAGNRKKTSKATYTETLDIDADFAATITYKGGKESPGNDKLIAAAQALAKILQSREES